MGTATRRLALISFALALWAGPAGPGRLSAQAPQQPVFRSGVDLIAVDVRIVDRNGNPIPGLRSDQFEVTVDGKPRRVVTAEFVEYAPGGTASPAAAAPKPAAPPGFSSNEEPAARSSPGRLIYLAVDQGSFKPLGARGAMEAARRFIDRLQPSDRVGLVAFPAPGPSVPAAVDHRPARAATAQITGRAMPFRSEGFDKNVSLSEAIDMRGGDAIVTEKVLARECAGLSGGARESCALDVRSTAISVGRAAEIQALRSMDGMQAVIRSLAQIPERKTLVLVSAGLPVADRSSMELQLIPAISALGREAAAANLNFYVLHVDSGFLDAFSAEQRTISDTLDRDLSLMGGGLETIAGSGGGSLVRIIAGADSAFDRVQRETSAAYLLGVEPTEADRDGRPHRIEVKVGVPGASVRSRREVIVPKGAAPAAPAAGAAPATREDALAATLREGRLETALPIRIATSSLAASANNVLRVLVGVDIGAGVDGPADMWIGYVIADAAGRAQPPVTLKRQLRPRAGGAAGSLPFDARLSLAPGRYTLRFAAIDAAGRAGSVSHAFTVALAKGDGVLLSDLLLMEPPAGADEALNIVPDGIVRGEAIDAYVEVVPMTAGETAPEVDFDVSDAPRGALVTSEPGVVTHPPGTGHWSAAARLSVAALEPGDYVVTAVVTAGGREIGRVERRMRVERRPPATVQPGTPAARGW